MNFRQPRKFASSTAAVSFLAAARTPLGGSDDDETSAVMGDFNGDGKPDVAKIVFAELPDSSDSHALRKPNGTPLVSGFQVAVLLGNGDGTFKAAALTPTDGNTDDPIVVGDLKVKGTDDIIQIHPEGSNCNNNIHTASAQPLTLPSCGSSIDVMISNGDGTFAAPVNYPVSNNSLMGGILTDINGDGKLDVLVFDNSSPANVIELLGNGDGTFASPTTLGQLTANAPDNMFFADFNGDGKLDLAGTNGPGQVQVTLASGAGLFANAPVSLNTPDNRYSTCGAIAGDLNGDSKPEIVTFNCEQNSVTVYVNSGTGTFATGVYYNNLASRLEGIGAGAIADMNGDGNNDIVAINGQTSVVSVFLGNGDGTVAVQPLAYDVGGEAYEPPLVADFNGDGLMDVVEADGLFNLVYLQGYGNGAFRAAPTYALPNTFDQNPFTFSLATGDFNGDKIPDLVVSQERNFGSTGVVVYLGKGDGTFFPGVSYGDSVDQPNVAVADFNGDGILDIAALDQDNEVIDIFLGNGDGTFSIGGSFSTDPNDDEPEPFEFALGDFNKDGKMDIAVVNGDDSSVGILLGNGDGTFAAPVAYPVGNDYEPESIAVGDFNGDGIPDLAIPSNNDDNENEPALVVMLGSSENKGTFLAPTYTPISSFPDEIAIGDLNKDGKLDVAITEENEDAPLVGRIDGSLRKSHRKGSLATPQEGPGFGGQIDVLLGKGDGTFAAPVTYPASTFTEGLGGPREFGFGLAQIQIADVNGDGNPDLVYPNPGFGVLAVATGVGDGTFNAPVEFPATATPVGLTLADVNGDGAMDVLTSQGPGGGFSVLLNGTGTGAAPNFTVGTQTPSQTVTSGSSATYMLTLAGTNGYTGTITFSCGNLPTGAACTFNPASVNAKDGEAITTTVTVSTTGSASASLLSPNRPGTRPTILLASLSGMGLFGLMLGGGRKRNIRIASAMMVLFLLCTLAGCSGTSSGGKGGPTPAGAYVVTVNSTGSGTAAPTHSTNLILVVQ